MENTILTIAVGILSVLMLCIFHHIIKGPRFTDRILAVSAINTIITAIICLISCYMDVEYLLDVALIYALLSFVGTALLMRLLKAEQEEEEDAL